MNFKKMKFILLDVISSVNMAKTNCKDNRKSNNNNNNNIEINLVNLLRD